MSTFNTDVIEIPSENMEKLEKKVSQINKKAVKNGLVPFILNVGDVIENEHEKMGVSYTTLSYPVSIEGEFPAINGWECIANIDHKDGVNIVNVYEEINVSKWRERKPTCDHCGHSKIKVHSYLIRNIESGEIMQIGKSCIKDYIKADPQYMLWMLSWVNNLDEMIEEEFTKTEHYEHYYGVAKIATVAAMSIRKNGFVSSDAFDVDTGNIPTKMDVNEYFFGNHDPEYVSYWKLTDEDREVSQGTVDYFLNQDANNNFTITIKQLMEMGQVRAKYFAYIAGAVAGYLKHLEREAQKVIDSKIVRVNEWVGEIKKRQDFNVVLESVITTCGFYGTTYVIKFRQDTGETLVWFASNPIDAEVGDSLTIKATVKKFDEFKGWKQTIITRGKVL